MKLALIIFPPIATKIPDVAPLFSAFIVEEIKLSPV